MPTDNLQQREWNAAHVDNLMLLGRVAAMVAYEDWGLVGGIVVALIFCVLRYAMVYASTAEAPSLGASADQSQTVLNPPLSASTLSPPVPGYAVRPTGLLVPLRADCD